MDTNEFIIISLPVAAFEPADTDNIIDCISGYTGARHGLSTFSIPNFKIGTLDALVQQADDLTKLDAACQGVIAKVAESFRTVIGNDEERIKQYKMINDRPIDQSVPEFTWNKARYRADKPLIELIDNIQKEVATTDHQVRAKLTQYQNAKANLISLERKQTGSLATRSLTPIIDPVILVRDSDYIETHMIVIPNTAKRDFMGTYETISPMVVPRSAVEVTNDSEFTLFAVSTFKKHSHDFLLKCRENKWTPRPFQYSEGGQELERLEFDRAANEEKRLRTDLLRIARTSWVESAMIWMHIITLKIFVEAVLRYGLPLEYVSIMIQATKKTIPKITSNLVRAFSYLGGNIDKNDSDSPSRHKNDVSSIADMAALGLPSHEGHDYLPFVYYDFVFP